MNYLTYIITPLLTFLILSLTLPLIFSAQQKAERFAENNNTVSYGKGALKAMIAFAVVLLLITAAAIACTILSALYPDMMHTSSEDIAGITVLLVLCAVLDALTVIAAVILTRKILYDEQSFSDVTAFGKKKTYLYSDITAIKNSVRISPYGSAYNPANTYNHTYGPVVRKGRLIIYLGDRCVKIPARMFGINKFIDVLRQKRSDLQFDLPQ